MAKQFVPPMFPIQFGTKFVLRILAQLLQSIFESNRRCVHELFLLWPQERTVNIVKAIDMEELIPMVDIVYL